MKRGNAITLVFILMLTVILAGCGRVNQGQERRHLADINTVHELREKLWTAADAGQRNEVIGSFTELPGPDAEAAEVLLAYLRERERTDAWSITDALTALMTDEQVAQLARELPVYGEFNGMTYLFPVLAARPGAVNPSVLTDAVVALQDTARREAYSPVYYRFVELAWLEVCSNPAAAASWLADTHARLTDPAARESLFYAVSGLVRGGGLTGEGRAAAVGWLWQVQEEEDDPAARGRQLVELYKMGETGALAEIKRVFTDLSVPERAGVIRGLGDAVRWSMGRGTDREAVVGWIWSAAKTDSSAFVRQVCLSTLIELDEKRATAELVREIDKGGLAVLKDERGIQACGLGWEFLKQVSKEHPQSYLARGIRAYERVRGEPYFAVARLERNPQVWPPYEYGDEQYDPKREIPGWEGFLAEFPRHPASDDAAYRLARCYEIEGRWAEALNTLHKALSLPDGDIHYHVAGRLVYILDVRMTGRQLRELSPSVLDPALRPLVEYTRAVKELRRDDYTLAAELLERFLSEYRGDEAPDPLARSPVARMFSYYGEEYQFRNEIERQLAAVKELAELKRDWERTKDPALLYGLAAFVYHNQMLYYNHLWLGGRQGYNWYGFINGLAFGRAPAEMAGFGRELINYSHSLDYFEQIYRDPAAPPELKAKALYSAGLCHIGIDQWGQDAWFAYSPPEVKRQIIATYTKFAKDYPGSSMADDALLVLGAYTGDARYLERIIAEYPDGDMVEKAARLLEEVKSPYYGLRLEWGPVPFKVLHAGDMDRLSAVSGEEVPETVREWVAANGRRAFTGSLTSGPWTYVLVAAGPRPTAGHGVEILNIRDDGRGRLTVNYRVTTPEPGRITAAKVITHPCVLARVPRTEAAFVFEELKPER